MIIIPAQYTELHIEWTCIHCDSIYGMVVPYPFKNKPQDTECIECNKLYQFTYDGTETLAIPGSTIVKFWKE